MKISISILKEKDNYKNAIEKVNKSKSDYLHLDILDNTFVNNTSFKIENFKDIKLDKKLDVHLMSNDLEKRINEYSKLNPEYITFHYEVGDTKKYIDLIKSKNIKVGLAINPETKVEEIYSFFKYIDLILIMDVKPGKGGQEFDKNIISKLKLLRSLKKENNFLLSVDGGINLKTINYVKDYADIIVVGSYITDSNDYNKQIDLLMK